MITSWIDWMVTHTAEIEAVLKGTQIIGIPVAIAVYGLTKRRERMDREYGTFDALDDKYADYQALCIAHPDLDVSDLPLDRTTQPNATQVRQEQAMMTILFSMFERAYLMYGQHSHGVRQRQWRGWRQYLEDWCGRSNFLEYAQAALSGGYYDEEFLTYLADEGLVAP